MQRPRLPATYASLADRLACAIQSDCYDLAAAARVLGLAPSRGFLVAGGAGAGKSPVLRAALDLLVERSGVRVVEVSAVRGVRFYAKDENAGKDFLKVAVPAEVLAMAKGQAEGSVAPVVVVMDDLLMAQGYDTLETAVTLFLARIAKFVAGIPAHVPIALVATWNKPTIASHPNLFPHCVQLPTPTQSIREEIMAGLLASLPETFAFDADIQGDDRAAQLAWLARHIASISTGYSWRDLTLVTRHLFLLSTFRTIKLTSVPTALHRVPPSLAVSEQYTRPVPRVAWSDVAGYARVVRKLQHAVLQPLAHPEAYARVGARAPGGVLLYGPHGCGKTQIVHALASEPTVNVVSVKGPELLSKYFGESESRLRTLFAEARKSAPCVLFFDELDALAAKRAWSSGSTTSSVNERVLSTLLNEMDGISARTGVVVVACTSRPDAIDDALLRPGRLDQLVPVPLPSRKDREAILGATTAVLAGDVDRRVVARFTTGCSGAEIKRLIRLAAVHALDRDLEAREIGWRDLRKAAEECGIRLPATCAREDKGVEEIVDGVAGMKVDEDEVADESGWVSEEEDDDLVKPRHTAWINEGRRRAARIMAPYIKFANARRADK
ncbi:hypothetical protein H9P43_009752 [Blastocladiella emersonii ATCC 22665]|nr:hypothetical protein H9P43_009752 [Blastocladiella emersonii ATCC 22665]